MSFKSILKVSLLKNLQEIGIHVIILWSAKSLTSLRRMSLVVIERYCSTLTNTVFSHLVWYKYITTQISETSMISFYKHWQKKNIYTTQFDGYNHIRIEPTVCFTGLLDREPIFCHHEQLQNCHTHPSHRVSLLNEAKIWTLRNILKPKYRTTGFFWKKQIIVLLLIMK